MLLHNDLKQGSRLTDFFIVDFRFCSDKQNVTQNR